MFSCCMYVHNYIDQFILMYAYLSSIPPVYHLCCLCLKAFLPLSIMYVLILFMQNKGKNSLTYSNFQQPVTADM